MKKFKFLITSSLLKKIKNKAFLISMIITSVLILAITILPGFITTNEDSLDTYNIVLVDQTDGSVDISEYLKQSTSNLAELLIVKNNNYDISKFWDDTYDALIIYEVSDELNNQLINVSTVKYYSKLNPSIDGLLREIVLSTKYSLLFDSEAYEIDLDVINEPGINPDKPNTEMDPEIFGFSTIVFTVMFMFIILSTQSLGAEILEEKSTKAIETIISSAPAEMHFYSKIISSVLFTAIQLGIMLIAGMIGILISKVINPDSTGLSDALNIFNQTGNISIVLILVTTIISIILGLVLYLILFAFFASFANNNEEYQKAITPMMIILLIIFYGSMILGGMQQISLIKGLSFVPFITPFLLPLSVMMGVVNIFEIILVFGVLIISIIFFTWLLLPAYKVSILSYSGDKLFKEIARSIKTSRATKKRKKNNLNN